MRKSFPWEVEAGDRASWLSKCQREISLSMNQVAADVSPRTLKRSAPTDAGGYGSRSQCMK